jgi:hypothetical protein
VQLAGHVLQSVLRLANAVAQPHDLGLPRRE